MRVSRAVAATLVLGVVLLGGLCWAASRVWEAADALQDVSSDGRVAVDAAQSGDVAALQSSLQTMAAAADRAADAAADPTWPVAEAMPVLGDDIRAIRIVADTAHALSAALSGPAAALGTDAGTAASGVSAAAADLGALAPALTDAVAAVAQARTELATLDTASLLSPVAKGVEQLRDVLEQVSPALDAARAVAAFVPTIMQTDGAQVLVVLQNGAEVRTGGGITGSFLLFQVQGGELTLVAQADSSAFSARATPIVPVRDSQTALYGDVSGRFVQNISMTADFAETAQLASAWWQSIGYSAPDAVVSLDVPTIAALLNVVGAIDLPDGTQLTADNAVQRLLVDPYLTLDSDAQTAMMQSAAATVFTAVTTAQLEPLRLLGALSGPVSEGRVSIWSSDSSVEELLSASLLGGTSARVAAAGPDAFAIAFNDATGGKMDSFLHVDVAVQTSTCRADGRSDVVVKLTMTSTAPASAAAVFPPSMTGNGIYGTAIGDIGTSVSVSAPPGSFFRGVMKDTATALSVDVEDDGRPTSLVRVNLSPGEINVVTFRFITATADPIDPAVVLTPLLNMPQVTIEQAAC
ncbi:DUF4012 domain-containing protein [Microbacterium sp.]|uniref:DUF4012 domain-containing protein n=1 Tax=Microbacterium sp. TaxID=51671 RepID=UPI0039E4FD07